MKRKHLKSALGIVVTLAFILLSIWYVVSNYDEFTHIAITNPLYLIPAVLFLVINIYGAGIVIDLAVEPHGVKLTKREAFGLAAITRFSNQFSPSYVGATIRATYMKSTYKVSYTKFSSSFIISNLLQFMISGIFTISTFFAMERMSTNDKPLVTVGILVAVFIALLYVPVSYPMRLLAKLEQRKGKLSKFFERTGELFENYAKVRKHPKLLSRTISWMFVTTLSFGLVYFLLYSSLGYQISLISALFIAALSSWSIIFAITPGSLGIREGLMVIAANIAGVHLSTTLVVAILLRLLMFVVSGVLSAYFAPRMLHTSIFRLK